MRSILPRSLLRQFNIGRKERSRAFHVSAKLLVVKPFLLADIGEGIRECEIIQWFVQPEARVEEFDKICEVQSDKASVDIPSRFSGVIKKLHYDAGDMAQVGKPLVDIDVQEDIVDDTPVPAEAAVLQDSSSSSDAPEGDMAQSDANSAEDSQQTTPPIRWTYPTLATPAVRHLINELDVDINEVTGTGRDARVTKEDVYNFAALRDSQPATSSLPSSLNEQSSSALGNGHQSEAIMPLSNVQAQMFKTMTRSLSIPHFLYADEIDFTNLSRLRHRVNKGLIKAEKDKLSFLPFIIKAMSLSLSQYPILNARVEISGSKPAFVMRSQHNIGIAMDTPSGLLVPVIKNVAAHNITSIASELSRLQSLAHINRLTSSDLSGGTITLTNIGSIGGTYVAPVLVDTEVAILGIGRMRKVPSFNQDGDVVPKQQICFSWSADHRVVDGATMARAAECVRGHLERPDSMLMHMR